MRTGLNENEWKAFNDPKQWEIRVLKVTGGAGSSAGTDVVCGSGLDKD